MWARLICCFSISSVFVAGQQLACPRYSQGQLSTDLGALNIQRQFGSVTRGAKRVSARQVTTVASANFIDDYIFGKMAKDSIEAAPSSSDSEFMRRVYLDITGRIPQPEAVEKFLSDTAPNKRRSLIDSLIAGDAYVDHWTVWLEDVLQLSVVDRYLGVYTRNAFHRRIQQFFRNDESYSAFVNELLTARGLTSENPSTAFIARYADVVGPPVQDFYDDITDRITVNFLGGKTLCISCHDGRRHLEKINLFLAAKKRTDLWRMSAFFSRLGFGVLGDGTPFILNLLDRDIGAYTSATYPESPGARPTRSGGPYQPVYIYTGEKPQTKEWRKEYSRIITGDRQFARAAVNYVWARFFNRGIVDPPDNWDFMRVDPKNPPPGDWPLQISHPELLEALADHFIQNNYSFKPLVRLIAQSNAYQLSSRYEKPWQVVYAMYFAKHLPRRLTAEEMYDALVTATGTETAMLIDGFPPLYYASQLPDPTEPSNDGNIRNLLNTLGRGDRVLLERQNEPSVMRILTFMNDYQVVLRSLVGGQDSATSRLAKLAASTLPEDQAIRQLFLATLTRPPTDDELKKLLAMRQGSREAWLSDVQWILLNKIDFAFNY